MASRHVESSYLSVALLSDLSSYLSVALLLVTLSQLLYIFVASQATGDIFCLPACAAY
jgi:hypothetical protein